VEGLGTDVENAHDTDRETAPDETPADGSTHQIERERYAGDAAS